MRQLALTRAAVLTPFERIEEATILISEGKILAVEAWNQIEIPPGFEEIPLEGLILAPGLIDQHVTGKSGGNEGPAWRADLAEMARLQAIHGVTAFLATVVGDFESALRPVAGVYRDFLQSQCKSAQCLGIRLEVPGQDSSVAGAFGARSVHDAGSAEHKTLEQLGTAGLKMVTLAPEIPGAMECAASLSQKGIAVAIGQSKADYATTLQAIESGFSCVSRWSDHPGSLEQQDPGVAGAALINAGLTIELIADGHRMHPATLELVWRTKGVQGIVLTGWNESAVNPLNSGITLEQTVRNFWQQTSCSLAEAFQLATYNPAKLLGFGKSKGSLAQGKDADIIAITPDFDVVMTMVGGEFISGLIAV